MLTEDEKNRILERVEFEEKVRKGLLEKDRQGESFGAAFWEKASSGLGLLIIGSVITGFLVPVYQDRQKTLEWERQIRYENVKYSLDMRRDCLREFMLTGTYISEIVEVLEPYRNEQPISKAEYEQLEQKLLELQHNRFAQNAKVVSLLVHFSDYDTVSRRFDDYTGTITTYINSKVRRFIFLKHSLSESQSANKEGDRKELEYLSSALADTQDPVLRFERVLKEMLADIRTKEDEYAKFRF